MVIVTSQLLNFSTSQFPPDCHHFPSLQVSKSLFSRFEFLNFLFQIKLSISVIICTKTHHHLSSYIEPGPHRNLLHRARAPADALKPHNA